MSPRVGVNETVVVADNQAAGPRSLQVIKGGLPLPQEQSGDLLFQRGERPTVVGQEKRPPARLRKRSRQKLEEDCRAGWETQFRTALVGES